MLLVLLLFSILQLLGLYFDHNLVFDDRSLSFAHAQSVTPLHLTSVTLCSIVFFVVDWLRGLILCIGSGPTAFCILDNPHKYTAALSDVGIEQRDTHSRHPPFSPLSLARGS